MKNNPRKKRRLNVGSELVRRLKDFNEDRIEAEILKDDNLNEIVQQHLSRGQSTLYKAGHSTFQLISSTERLRQQLNNVSLKDIQSLIKMRKVAP